MAAETATDHRIGAAITLGVIAAAGALAMWAFHDQGMIVGGGFAVAVGAGSLAIVALHVYD